VLANFLAQRRNFLLDGLLRHVVFTS
jgi:hypothetical protein